MARCKFSETQFVFGFFHHYLNINAGNNFTFSIPSLRAEGDKNDYRCGADLVINHNYFIQFKVSDYLYSPGTSEINKASLTADFLPYYRFDVKNDNPTNQFDILKQKAGNPANTVLYVAPLFWDEQGCDYFISEQKSQLAMDLVVQINFNQFHGANAHINIGQTNDHKICYSDESISSGYAYLFSDKYKIEIKKGFESFITKYQTGGVITEKKEKTIQLKDFVSELVDEFKIKITNDTKLSTIQRHLAGQYDIFWIPIFHKNE